MAMHVNQRIEALRKAMKRAGIDACIIPSADPHLSEEVAAHWKSREWVSGFTGSAGTVIVTQEHAGLWTDSRYFLQAEQQLTGTEVALHKLVVPHTPEHLDWICDNLPEGSTVGLDGFLFSVAQVRNMAKVLERKKIRLESRHDLISEIWKDRPPMPAGQVFELPVSHAGQSRAEKLSLLQEKLKSAGADFYFLSTLDDIAWVFNLRGNDIRNNPVFISYAAIGSDRAYIFAEKAKFQPQLLSQLNDDSVFLKPYGEAESFLQNIPTGMRVMFDKATISLRLFNSMPEGARLEGENLIAPLKAIKNSTELGHTRRTMIADGVALVRAFRWLERELSKREVAETEVADKLIECRGQQEGYMGESFDAIVGYQSNGAIVHYKPEPESCAMIRNEGILLVDCGGQYLGGTTDITRTIALSTPTDLQRKDFTLVLKGVLALSMAHFPKGANGIQMDTMARQYLWRHARNYGHGTGHGVGYFLNVHEGPHGFSPVVGERTRTPIEPGTITSNEPGLYRTGQYGIRTENLILCVVDETNDFGSFLKFETLTLFPIDLSLIDVTMLDSEEKNWLNDYHRTVFERLSALLDQSEIAWLREKCRPI